MQGMHGDQLDMLGLAVHALLESHSLCVGLAAQSRGTHLHTPISRALVHAKATIDEPSPGKPIERAISCTKQTAWSAHSACFGHVQALVSKRPSSHVAGGRTFTHVTCLHSQVRGSPLDDDHDSPKSKRQLGRTRAPAPFCSTIRAFSHPLPC